MKNSKRIVGICVTAAALGLGAGAAGVVLYATKPHSEITHADYKLTFEAGNGVLLDEGLATVNGWSDDTLDRLPQPRVMSNKEGYHFAGWINKANGQPVTGKQKFAKDTTLVASYNETSASTCTVSFTSDDSSVTFLGNQTVSVRVGYSFYMVNRPLAKSSKLKWFNCWIYKDSRQPVSENDVITGNVEIVPYFTEGVKITWDPNEEQGGVKVRGKDYTENEIGTTFKEFNQPQLMNTRTLFFDGWYNKSTGAKISQDTVVSSDFTAIAHWTEAPSAASGYATLAFIANESAGQPATSEVSFAPNAYSFIKVGTTDTPTPVSWANVAIPTVSTTSNNWKVKAVDASTTTHEQAWQVSKTNTASDWVDLTDSFNFEPLPAGQDKYYVRPVLESSITAVNIIGKSTVLPETNTDYKATVQGGTQEIEWKLYKDAACTKECKKLATDGAIVDTWGTLSVASLTKDADGNNPHYYLKAKSVKAAEQGKDVSSVKEIEVEMPYESETNKFNERVWFQETDAHSGETHWWSFLSADLCNPHGEYYSASSINGDWKDFKRVATQGEEVTFTYKIYVGNGIPSIPGNFMKDFQQLSGDASVVLPSNISVIGAGFMQGCKNFNGSINLENITSFGSGFMYNCAKFDQPIKNLNANLTTIGDDFLGLCRSFNNEIVLPTTTSLTIGHNFMHACTSFDQDITIPSNVTSVLTNFMNNCASFTHTITVDCSVDAFEKSPNDLSASAPYYTDKDGLSQPSNIFFKGFKTAGANGAEFASTYGNSWTDESFRTIQNTAGTRITTAANWTNMLKAIFDTTTVPNYTVLRSTYDDINPEYDYGEQEFVQVESDGQTAPKPFIKIQNNSREIQNVISYQIYDPTINHYIGADAQSYYTGLIDEDDFVTEMKTTFYDNYLDVPEYRDPTVSGSKWTYEADIDTYKGATMSEVPATVYGIPAHGDLTMWVKLDNSVGDDATAIKAIYKTYKVTSEDEGGTKIVGKTFTDILTFEKVGTTAFDVKTSANLNQYKILTKDTLATVTPTFKSGALDVVSHNGRYGQAFVFKLDDVTTPGNIKNIDITVAPDSLEVDWEDYIYGTITVYAQDGSIKGESVEGKFTKNELTNTITLTLSVPQDVTLETTDSIYFNMWISSYSKTNPQGVIFTFELTE